MKAVIYADVAKYEIKEVPVPEIKCDTDMLVKVLACSICGTDVHIMANPPGYKFKKGIIGGHEFVGEVVKTGSRVKSMIPGDRLICDNNIPCGVCDACLSGNSNVCQNMNSLGVDDDGVFAEYVVIPESSAVKIKKTTPVDAAIFAEPLNCVMGGVVRLKVEPGMTAVVLGGGPIGMYYARLLKLNGATNVIVSEVSEFRAGYALKNGADRVVNPAKENLKDEVMKETNNYGADIVVDAVGVLINDAIQCVCPGGQVLIFGLNAAAKQTICQTDITTKNITIQGSFIGRNTLRSVGKVLDSGLVNFDNLITHRLSLDEFGTGLEAMRKGEAFEVIMYPDGEVN